VNFNFGRQTRVLEAAPLDLEAHGCHVLTATLPPGTQADSFRLHPYVLIQRKATIQ